MNFESQNSNSTNANFGQIRHITSDQAATVVSVLQTSVNEMELITLIQYTSTCLHTDSETRRLHKCYQHSRHQVT